MHTLPARKLRRVSKSLYLGLALAPILASPAATQEAVEVPIIDLSTAKKASVVKAEIEAHGVFTPIIVTERVYAAVQNKTVLQVQPQLDDSGNPALLTAGQAMHIYVASSGGSDAEPAIEPEETTPSDDPVGPIDGKPLLQWGTILGTLGFVICLALRVFRRD